MASKLVGSNSQPRSYTRTIPTMVFSGLFFSQPVYLDTGGDGGGSADDVLELPRKKEPFYLFVAFHQLLTCLLIYHEKVFGTRRSGER